MSTETITLKEFLGSLKFQVHSAFPSRYWIIAEIAGFRVHQSSGHCYFSLVEKKDNTTVANVGAVIWKGKFQYLNRKFADAAGQELKDGLKLLVCAEVLFHELFGLKLSIIDINPSYTVGEFALYREEIIQRLIQEGIISKNKELFMPLVPQKIAVISSPSSAGYEDFINTLENNPYGYRFSSHLFPAHMQGAQTEESILKSFEKCDSSVVPYDIVIIIRGGGDQVDLHSFDSYKIGRAIALSGAPVLTGIGHKRDETVADITAFKNLITPTAVAEFIIARVRNFEERVKDSALRLNNKAEYMLAAGNNTLNNQARDVVIFSKFLLHKNEKSYRELLVSFRNNVSKNIAACEFNLRQLPVNLLKSSSHYFKNRSVMLNHSHGLLRAAAGSLLDKNRNMIDRQNDKTDLINPSKVLQRGYTMTLSGGKILKDIRSVSVGTDIETRFFKGKAESRVTRIDTGRVHDKE